MGLFRGLTLHSFSNIGHGMRHGEFEAQVRKLLGKSRRNARKSSVVTGRNTRETLVFLKSNAIEGGLCGITSTC